MSSISSLDENNQDALQKTDVHQSFSTLNDPFRVAEMAFELQIEKLRAIEALKARDVALQRLADAYTLLRQKTEQLESIQSTNGEINVSTSSKQADVNYMGVAVKMLREESQTFKDLTNNLASKVEPPPSYEAELGKGSTPSANDSPAFLPDLKADIALESRIIYSTPGSDEPSEMVHARYALLAGIPVPPDAPEDTLRPIVLPPPITLSEFINAMSGVSAYVNPIPVFNTEMVSQPLRTSLLNYRILHGVTTVWCPEREEHGYFYAPKFKCNTNPRVVTAHRWSQVDVISPMSKPTGKHKVEGGSHITMVFQECFFNKDGAWYYAGIYKGFAMDDLTAKEWAHLSPETTQAVIKETLSGRKNTSPQNVYETGQLYAAGALKVACVGLQCVGFNQAMYKALLEHAGRFTQNKTKTPSGHGIGPIGSASPRAHWSPSCRSPKE